MSHAQPGWRVLIGSRSFGKAIPEHITALEAAGCEVVRNNVGRAYRAAELLEVLPSMDAIITGTDELNAEVIAAASRLKTITKHGVGLETIDLDAARARNVVVTATPGSLHDSVADLTLALLLALARYIVPAHLSTQAGLWQPFFGMELRGKILGIVGLGRIGQAVCIRAQAFGMRVIAADPYPDHTFATEHDVTFVTLAELLAASEQTTGPLLGAAELAQVKAGAFLINTARGVLVDEAALVEALCHKRLAGAGLDAFIDEPPIDSPLLKLDNVVLTPHLGGRTLDCQRHMGEMAIENCLRVLRGEAPLYRV